MAYLRYRFAGKTDIDKLIDELSMVSPDEAILWQEATASVHQTAAKGSQPNQSWSCYQLRWDANNTEVKPISDSIGIVKEARQRTPHLGAVHA